MDDTLKIKALMIYYDHWGKEESRIHKTIEGAKKFKEQIYLKYSNRYESHIEVLMDSDKSSFKFWYSMVDCLLPGMDHWVMDYRDYITKPLHAKIRFAEMIGTIFYDVLRADLSNDQMKNVNAIVALPVL